MSISSMDQALIGQVLLNKGKANGIQVISADWVARMTTPCAIAPFYGYLVWINHQRRIFPDVSEASYFAIGAGSSFTWIEPDLRMVLIVRWIDAAYANGFFKRILSAVRHR